MNQVGRYQILEELGRGAHGVVYKALDPAIGRSIAIKAIPLGPFSETDQERVRQGILREARLAGTLSHPNIVTVYDVLDQDDSAYIFMEFVDGRSLEEAIALTKNGKPGKLSRSRFLSILKQVAQALDYAHRKGVVHRDIKPANIVLTDHRSGGNGEGDMLAKIADFGVAKFVSHDVTQQISGQRVLIGTPSYMSPEQVQGTGLTGASDQFSLAVICYEILCGRKPFEADSIDTLLYRIRNESEMPVDVVNTVLSTTVSKVMLRALAKNPDDRFGSCSELAGALEFALGDSPRWEPGVIGPLIANAGRAVIAYDPEAQEEQKSWRNRFVLLAALCVAIAVAIVLIVRMNSGPSIATEVLDTQNGPAAPPPSVQELQYEKASKPPSLDLSQATPSVRANAPTVVMVPVPEAVPKKNPRVLQPVTQLAGSPENVEVQIATDPPGANVIVDGRHSCNSPCSMTLAGGRHTLATRLDGYTVARRIFNLPADSSIIMELQKSQGVLVVSSDPPGASVNVDGRGIGATPLKLTLAPGIHQISVWDGSKWRQQSVQISADEVDARMFRF